MAGWLERTLSPERLALVRTRIREAAAQIAGRPTRDRFGARLACPLLEEDRCVVYPVRPGACIAENAMDARTCEAVYRGDDAPDTLHAANPSMRIAGYIPSATAHLVLTAAAAPPPEPLELITALKIALDTPGAALAWLQGIPIFAPARRSVEDMLEAGAAWAPAEKKNAPRTGCTGARAATTSP